MSLINVVRHGYFFVQTYSTSTPENPQKYKLSNISLITLWISMAYILSSIFTGITL